jgi:hypothetical protein
MNPKDTTIKLQQDFDSLMGNYRRMTQMLLDGLAPNVPQERRNELRKLFTPFVKEAPRKAKPDVEPGAAALE